MKRSTIIFILNLFVLLSSINAQVDTVYTKNGEVYYGTAKSSLSFTRISTQGNANITLSNDNIARIGFAERVEFKIDDTFKNPDGEKISFHFTPYILGGDEVLQIGNDEATFEYENTWNYTFKIKIPINNWTISPFYESSSRSLKIEKEEYFSEINSYLMGITFSLYLK